MAAAAAYEQAARALSAETAAAFPIGTTLYATLGRARVKVEVTATSAMWWSRPSYVTGRNVETGKLRSFDVTSDMNNVIVIQRPGE